MNADADFQALYETEFQPVFRSVYLLCGDRELAEDCTQEAFARALERWGRLRHVSWLGGWLTTTAMNHARRTSRRADRAEAVPGSPNEPEEGLDLWAQIRRLPRRQQEAVVLYYVEDLPTGQISEVMRCREGTVRALLAQARERLRSRLEVRDER